MNIKVISTIKTCLVFRLSSIFRKSLIIRIQRIAVGKINNSTMIAIGLPLLSLSTGVDFSTMEDIIKPLIRNKIYPFNLNN